MLVQVRDLLVMQRTMLSNAIRGHAAKFGVTGAKEPQKLDELLKRIGEDQGEPAPAREVLNDLASQIAALADKGITSCAGCRC
jgi:transposase